MPEAGARNAAQLYEDDFAYERGDAELDGERDSRARSPLEEELRAMRRFVELSKNRPRLRRLVRAHPAWIRDRLARLDELLARDPVRARVEILKHLDGPLQIRPLPAPAGQRAAEIIGRVKPDSLLAAADQEAGCLRIVAGARNHLPANRSLEFRFEIRA